MKRTIAVICITTIHSIAHGTALTENDREIRFTRREVLACGVTLNPAPCLKKFFGNRIGFDIVNERTIVKVTLPISKTSTYRINGKLFRGTDLSMRFLEDYDYYTVCGTTNSIRIGNLKFSTSGGWVCGFVNHGEFKHNLPSDMSFVSNKTQVEIDVVSCKKDGELSLGNRTFTSDATGCGYKIPKGTQFYRTVEGVQFVAPADGSIDMGDGSHLGVWKGSKYVNQATKEQPCKWRDATPDTPQNSGGK